MLQLCQLMSNERLIQGLRQVVDADRRRPRGRSTGAPCPRPISEAARCSGVYSLPASSCGGITSDSVDPTLAAIEKNCSASAKRAPSSKPPSSSKRHHGAEIAHLPPRQLVLRVALEARIVDTLHARVLAAETGSPRAHWRIAARSAGNRCACRAESGRPRADRASGPSTRCPCACAAISSRARDDRAAHHIAVARGVLGQAVQKDIDVVSAVVVKAGKGVVEHRQSAGAPRMRGQVLDVGDLGDRIGGTFEHHQARRHLAQHPLDAGAGPRSTAGCESRRTSRADAARCSASAHRTRRTRERDRPACTATAGSRRWWRRPTPSADSRPCPAAAPASSSQLRQGRIRRARVEKSLALAAQVAQRLVGIVERELHRLVDRRHQRTIVRGQRRRRADGSRTCCFS